jgi:hypothetical protein
MIGGAMVRVLYLCALVVIQTMLMLSESLVPRIYTHHDGRYLTFLYFYNTSKFSA